MVSITAELIEPGEGKLEIADAYVAYATGCKAANKRPVTPDQFVEPMRKVCREAGIKIEASGEHVYLMRVQLKAKPRARDTQA